MVIVIKVLHVPKFKLNLCILPLPAYLHEVCHQNCGYKLGCYLSTLAFVDCGLLALVSLSVFASFCSVSF